MRSSIGEECLLNYTKYYYILFRTPQELAAPKGSFCAFLFSLQSRYIGSTEFTLLHCLMQHAGQVVSKAELYRRALGRAPMQFDRSIDMHISNLRKKLAPGEGGAQAIETVRGQGYQLVVRG